MPSWKGNPTNPIPNIVQEGLSRSEKFKSDNRSKTIRRDTDKQKDNVITLMDVDTVIFNHLESMQISVIDEGSTIRVPILYGSPEKWVAARRDGYIRDRQGKIQLPAIVFRRVNSANDDDIEIFNRYVKYPVIQKNSVKNKYSQFSVLSSQIVPTNEVYNITMADHMVFTYSFMIWTEYHEQMNPIIEKIKFNTKDYWGSSQGFRFRTRAEDFSHMIELNSNEDRMVRTEFNLITNGYILPESYQLLDRQYPTTEKLFTPKKLVMGSEFVGDDVDLNELPPWKSKLYPNLDRGQEPKVATATWEDEPPVGGNVQLVHQIIGTLRRIQATDIDGKLFAWHPVPAHPTSHGKAGWMAYDDSYLYIYNGIWKRVALALFS